MERIHVTVRARPLSAEESKSSPWRVVSNSILNPNHSSKFDFDRIFSEDCRTMEVYESRTKEIVCAAVKGFNGTVFAYGQTNSGKTYTMRGSGSEPGVIPLAVNDLFDTIRQDIDREFLLRMSYMEIYNEEINDLLAPEHRKLQIHESIERGIYVAGLREEIVVSSEQVLNFMEFGESNRHVGETNMNVHSSRSHTIFRMIIESRDKTEDGDSGSSCDAVRVSVLNLVDLAGSERAAKTGAEGVRLKEGSHINKSLMTLGTVIKKLSEGAESQGGHVPYRDSKLTRILQPALGGNSNTAIICNITLAQIHADETKSSLQFASRALCVKNCAQVNEILTDAALLKRQKKEIEELREKLQGSHSEDLGKEILNLRNTLLQTELERERIALELEEERKAQAEWEKTVQEQAKKIENLSSMVLSSTSNRDDNRDRFKRGKRRGTWCAGNLSWETIEELSSTTQSKASADKPMRAKRETEPLLLFEELMESIPEDEPCNDDDDCESNASEDFRFPDQCAVLHITNRRKPPLIKKSISNDNKVADIQAAYEALLIQFETLKLESGKQIDFLARRLAEVDSLSGTEKCYEDGGAINEDGNSDSKASESVVEIKRLQGQIEMLEIEKASSQQNVASIVELATKQNLCAREKCEELYGKLCDAREEARVAHEQFTSKESEGNSAFITKLLIEVQDIISEVQESKVVIDSISSLVFEVAETFPSLFEALRDLKTSLVQSSLQENAVIGNHQKLNLFLMQKVSKLENEKDLLSIQLNDVQNQIEEFKLEAENSDQSLRAFLEQQDLEKEEYLSHIQILEREISNVSSCSLAKEKESLRKDLEKTKLKLKDTEFKLKNAMQEKTKLEGARAIAEREIKRLNGQNSLLERDINKRESLAGRRRESFLDKNSKMCDPKKLKGLGGTFDQEMQEEYRKLEVHAFEMETKIGSLEEELSSVFIEKDEILSRNKDLASDLQALSEKLNTSNAEMSLLQEEVSALKQKLEDSKLEQQQIESSIKLMLEEKEELSMLLSDSLLEMEEEKAVWSAKEKASIEAIEEKTKLYCTEFATLSEELSKVRSELESRTNEHNMLRERLQCLEEEMEKEKNSIVNKIPGDQLPNSTDLDKVEIEQSHDGVDKLRKDITSLEKEREDLLIKITDLQMRPDLSNDFQCIKNQLLITMEERDKLKTKVQEQHNHAIEVEFVNNRYNDKLEQAKAQVEELSRRISCMDVKKHEDNESNTKLRMRLRSTQKKLDAFRDRHRELVEDADHMNKKYEEAAAKLKERLASKGTEVLNLKKQLLALTA